MTTWVADGRYALRALTRQPSFTLIALLTLTLGIGANTAIFSVVKAVLLNPLPYEDPERVLVLWEVNVEGNHEQVSIPTQDTGEVLWEINLGSPVTGYPITYAVDGRQYVVASTGIAVEGLTPELRPSIGNNLFVFALPDRD